MSTAATAARSHRPIDADGLVTSYTVDPDAAGPAAPFTFDNPSFDTRSLIGNVVYRWEYRPGSTLYLVWTQSRSDQLSYVGNLDFARDRTALLATHPDNIFLVKVNYWLGSGSRADVDVESIGSRDPFPTPSPRTTLRRDATDPAARARRASPPPRPYRSTGPSTATPARRRCSCCTAGRPRATTTCCRRCSRSPSEHRLVTYDQRGGGRSRYDDDRAVIGWRDQVDDVARVAAELRVAPLTIVGYSWGGLLAMLYAIEAAAGRVRRRRRASR